MEKDLLGVENSEIRGSISGKKNKENLEISSTGYGYVAVPGEPEQNKADNH